MQSRPVSRLRRQGNPFHSDTLLVMADKKNWLQLLAYVTGSINQELLLRNEYLAAENHILKS